MVGQEAFVHTQGEPQARRDKAPEGDTEPKIGQGCGSERDASLGAVAPGDAGFSLDLVPERRSAILRTKDGTSLELSLMAWANVLADLERRVAALTGFVADPARPSFGPRPGRHGADWSVREASLLTKEYESGMAVAALALAHQRSTSAVEAQLVKLGLLTYADCQYTAPRRY